MALKVFEHAFIFLIVFERSSGILAITIIIPEPLWLKAKFVDCVLGDTAPAETGGPGRGLGSAAGAAHGCPGVRKHWPARPKAPPGSSTPTRTNL
eukprot:8973390-Heterocapsa_arctica.AAC.1